MHPCPGPIVPYRYQISILEPPRHHHSPLSSVTPSLPYFCLLALWPICVTNMVINTTGSLVAGPGLRLKPPAKLSGRRLPGSSCRARTASNGFRTYCMKTRNPFTNTRYEALSYLPPLTEESIAKEVEFIMSKGWVPCLEFDNVPEKYAAHAVF
ncbi:hypothetical protein EJB05_25256, partial [Eragrostis curvula]